MTPTDIREDPELPNKSSHIYLTKAYKLNMKTFAETKQEVHNLRNLQTHMIN